MCKNCDFISGKDPEALRHIGNHNAIWQNCLALKIIVHNTWLELEDHETSEYYAGLEKVFAEFLDRINIAERRSYDRAKEMAERLL